MNYQQSNSGQQGGGQQRQAAKAAFRQKCRTILNRQALRQEKTILEPGQIRFRALGNYLNSLQQQDIQNQSPEIVGIIENMTDLMNQMVDIDIDMMSFYPEESDKAMAEEAKTKLEKDITVYLNNYLNTLEENQRDSLIRRIKKFRVKMKKRTDDKTTQGQKQPVTTTTTSNTTTLLIPRPPGPQTSGDSRRKKRRNSNSSSKPGHGLNDHSLSSVLTDPDEQNQQQFMNRLSSLEPTHKGISSLLRQSDKINIKVADILSTPIFDVNDAQLEKQLQELMRKYEQGNSSAPLSLPVSSSSVSNTSNVGGKGSSSSSVDPSLTQGGRKSSSSSVDPVSLSKTAGKQTDIGTGEGGPKTSSTVSTTSNMVNIFNAKKILQTLLLHLLHLLLVLQKAGTAQLIQ